MDSQHIKGGQSTKIINRNNGVKGENTILEDVQGGFDKNGNVCVKRT